MTELSSFQRRRSIFWLSVQDTPAHLKTEKSSTSPDLHFQLLQTEDSFTMPRTIFYTCPTLLFCPSTRLRLLGIKILPSLCYIWGLIKTTWRSSSQLLFVMPFTIKERSIVSDSSEPTPHFSPLPTNCAPYCTAVPHAATPAPPAPSIRSPWDYSMAPSNFSWEPRVGNLLALPPSLPRLHFKKGGRIASLYLPLK